MKATWGIALPLLRKALKEKSLKNYMWTGMHYSFDKETLKHFSKSRIWGENTGNLETKLYYLYPVMNEVLLW